MKITVIGGGLAGSSTALRLVRQGHRVSLYEKKRFPRPKLCGGFLSSDGLADLEDLGILGAVRQAGAHPIVRSVVASVHGTRIESELSGEAVSVSRSVLDTILLDHVRKDGVTILQGDGYRAEPTADYTVIAAGRIPKQGVPSKSYFGVQALFQDVRGISDQVELDLIESGYVGLARQENGYVNICALTTQEALQHWGPSLDGVLSHFMDENPVLRDHVRDARRVSSWLATGPVQLGVRHLSRERTFYVGDAACVVDPFAGEGMSMALYGSRLVLQALQQKTMSPERAYAAYWKEAFLPSLRWNAVMRMLYSVSLFREPVLHALKVYPAAMTWLTDLTRHRLVDALHTELV